MTETDIFLVLEGHDFYNEAQTMAQVFYPNRKYIRTDEVSDAAITVKSALYATKCAAFVFDGGLLMCAHEETPLSSQVHDVKNCIKQCIYIALSKHTGILPKWGILTGIRPAKLARGLLEAGKSESEILETFGLDYLVSAEKAALAVSVAKYGMKILSDADCGKMGDRAVHLYAGIPFCPSTCLYCSFTSYPIEKYREKAVHYLDCLREEIAGMPDTPLRSVYIGGGTPTSLDEEQLDYLMSVIAEKYDTDGIEYTVEAGRPDTLSFKKLEIMKKRGVNRLSINPQTMSNETLRLVGRRHTAEDIEDAFKMARAVGFDNINMDLIVGLPGETPETVKYTMERLMSLLPDSITVHTLAVKRASRLNENLSDYSLGKRRDIEEMLEITKLYAEKMDMAPYSMYRQKNMLGNFENVGWCKKGRHSIFNIETLEETGTILAAGAGAVTKIVEGDKISRIFNVKNVDEYMLRINEIVGNKSMLKLD